MENLLCEKNQKDEKMDKDVNCAVSDAELRIERMLVLKNWLSREMEDMKNEERKKDVDTLFRETFGKYESIADEELIQIIEKYMWMESLQIYMKEDVNLYKFWIYLYNKCMNWFDEQYILYAAKNDVLSWNLKVRVERLDCDKKCEIII